MRRIGTLGRALNLALAFPGRQGQFYALDMVLALRTRVRLQRLDDLGRPGARVDARAPLLDLALAVDHHADARRTLLRIGVGAVGGADRPVGVADQREVEAELLGELLVVGGAIEGRAEDDGVLSIVVGFQVAEPATLGRSARSVGLRVEPEHDRLALEVRQLHGVAVVVASREIGRLVSWLEHESSCGGWDQAFRKASRSASMVSASVVGM